MALNFPADPSAQTPANTFSPTSTPQASDNGVTYTWDGDKWTASAESSSDLYLSSVSDDTAAGANYF